MPLTKKGKEIMKSMQKQYGKKKAEKIFYASKNAGKITGVEKDMKVKKAKSGKYFEMLGVKPTINKKTLTPKSIETKPDKKGGDIFIKLAKSKLSFNGGGIAVKGTKFKGVF